MLRFGWMLRPSTSAIECALDVGWCDLRVTEKRYVIGPISHGNLNQAGDPLGRGIVIFSFIFKGRLVRVSESARPILK